MEAQGQKLPAQSGQHQGTGAQDRWVGLAPQALTRRRVSALWQQRQKLRRLRNLPHGKGTAPRAEAVVGPLHQGPARQAEEPHVTTES